jgi:hypothetical protein
VKCNVVKNTFIKYSIFKGGDNTCIFFKRVSKHLGEDEEQLFQAVSKSNLRQRNFKVKCNMVTDTHFYKYYKVSSKGR